MGTSTFQRSFAGGELAPSLAARADTAKYLAGLRTCRNFYVLRHGGVANRPGFRYINTTRDSSTAQRLLRYVSEVAGASLLLEAGAFYLRVYQNGALVRLTGVVAYNGAITYHIGDIAVSGGVNYYCIKQHTAQAPPNVVYWYPMPADILELPIPFGNAGFAWVQNDNVITLTGQLAPPTEVIFNSLTNWVVQPVITAPQIHPPTAVVGAAGAAGTLSYAYIVTARELTTYEESVGSAIAQILNLALPTPAVPAVISWAAPTGPPLAGDYDVYKDPFGNGVFGYIGTASGQLFFSDTGLDPDYAVAPPQPRILFASAGNYPAVCGYYQQRRFFANTINEPSAIWGSRVGFYSNFNTSTPLQEDDALTFKLAANQRNPVRHLLGLRSLVVLTDAGEWSVAGSQQLGGPVQTVLGPNSIATVQDGYIGASDVPPIVLGNSIVYVQARGSIVRDLQFSLQVEGLAGRDITLFASHLFDGQTINRMDYQQTPQSIAWCCRSDGTLLGLTYIREEDVWGWHRHDTGAGGRIEDVCVVPEPGEDALYVIVRRTIGGVFKRYIERLERRTILHFAADSFFVDAGLTYTGPPTVTSIAGLDHLEGQVVAVVCDGAVVFNGDPADPRADSFTVTGGTIAAVLPASTIVHAGLPIQFGDLELLDLDVQGSTVRDKKKRVGSVSLLIDTSARTFWVGPDTLHLRQHKLDPFEANPGLPFSGQEEIRITADYNKYGRVCIRQIDPLPLTVLGVLPNVELGG